jgi:hypothetical protein
MRVKKINKYAIVFFSVITFIACDHKKSGINKNVKHLILLPYSSSGNLYVDSVPNKSVLKEQVNDNGIYKFCSFKVGFTDSTIYEKKEQLLLNKYFDYEMQKDWVAVVNGDSITPVLLQPMVKKNSFTREFLLVFEINKHNKIDSLAYKNNFKQGTILQIALNK